MPSAILCGPSLPVGDQLARALFKTALNVGLPFVPAVEMVCDMLTKSRCRNSFPML